MNTLIEQMQKNNVNTDVKDKTSEEGVNDDSSTNVHDAE